MGENIMFVEMKHVLEKERRNPTPTNDQSSIAASIVRARIKNCCYNPPETNIIL